MTATPNGAFKRKLSDSGLSHNATDIQEWFKLMWRHARQGDSSLLREHFKDELFASLSQMPGISTQQQQQWTQVRQAVARVTTSNVFSVFMTVVVLTNLVVVLVEADSRVKCEDLADQCSSLNTAVMMDHAITVVYVVEMLLRLYVYQSNFLHSIWNVVDGIVVIICVIGVFADNLMQSASLIRLIRLVRVVRVLRVLTMFQELHLMIAGLASTVRTIFWACLVLSVIIAVLSVVALEVLRPIQQQLVQEFGINEECPRCARAFASLIESMFTLFSTLVLGDGVLDILVPLAENDVYAALVIIGSVAFVYLGISNLILSVIVEKSNEARCQDTFYQAINNQSLRLQARQELVELWRDVAPEDRTTISLAELKELWASSTRFHDYFHSMDIDMGFLEYALTSMDSDGDGQVSFHEFAASVVSIKNTDPGPVVAFIKHSLLDALSEISSFKAQCVSFHQDVLKRISECEAATVASVTIEAGKMSASKSEVFTPVASPTAAQASTPTTSSPATLTDKEETLPRTRLIEHRSFPVPTLAFHPTHQSGELVPRHPMVDDVNPIIALERGMKEHVHRIESEVKHLMVAISSAEESVQIDWIAQMLRLLASLSEALPRHMPPCSPSQAPNHQAPNHHPPTSLLPAHPMTPPPQRPPPNEESHKAFSPSGERPAHIGSHRWRWRRKGTYELPHGRNGTDELAPSFCI